MITAERPLAIGVIHADRRVPDAEVQRLRLDLANYANREGYALLDTLVVGRPSGHSDAAIWETVHEIAERFDASALLISGSVDRHAVDFIADAARLLVVNVPHL